MSFQIDVRGEIAQMVEQVISKFFLKGPEFKSNQKQQLFVMNPELNLNYHAETHLTDIL